MNINIPYYLIYDDGKGVLALVNSCFDLIQGVIGGIIGITIYRNKGSRYKNLLRKRIRERKD